MKNSSATIRNIRVSPKKLILLGKAIKGKALDDAYWIIKSSKKGYSQYYVHALSNAESILKEKSVEPSIATVKNVSVDQGSRLKRFRPGSKGYSYIYKHPLSHLTVELSSKEHKPNNSTSANMKKSPKKEKNGS